jgi:hypothetical protein
MQSASTSKVTSKPKITWIPDDFVILVGPENEEYLVPEFMLPKLYLDYHSKEMKRDFGSWGAKGTVSVRISQSGIYPAFIRSFRLQPRHHLF